MRQLFGSRTARTSARFNGPRTALLCTALALLLGTGPANQCAPEGTVYGLTVDSTFTVGCFPPLRCPVQIAQGIGGTFRLVEIPTPTPEIERFFVKDVFWLVRIGDADIPITGSGTFTRLSEFTVRQTLQLFLRIGDAEVEEFRGVSTDRDRAEFPEIDITISKNGEMFFDTVIHLRVIPFPSLENEPDGPRVCGQVTCPLGQECCNPLRGVCVLPGEPCLQGTGGRGAGFAVTGDRSR